MTSKIQFIENSDRIHVCENSFIQQTFCYGWGGNPSKEEAEESAFNYALELIAERTKEGFDIVLLPKENR